LFLRRLLPFLLFCFILVARSSALEHRTDSPAPQEKTSSSDFDRAEDKVKEAVRAFSETLSQWALLIATRSILILVGKDYHGPQETPWRYIYVLLLPGWIFLGFSLYYGMTIQQEYVGYSLEMSAQNAAVELSKLAEQIRDNLICQRTTLQWAL